MNLYTLRTLVSLWRRGPAASARLAAKAVRLAPVALRLARAAGRAGRSALRRIARMARPVA